MTKTLKIQPVDLVDLTVTTDHYAYTLTDFTVSGGFLVGEIDATLSVSSVTISSSGYATQSFMYRNLPNEVVLVAQEVEILSDGTESYQISDKVARLMLEDKADISDIPTKTSELTNDSNFATVSQIPTNNNQLTNGAGYITGITSSDVTTALGYTPADDSDVVKTTGNQTVGGTKTFSSYIKATSQVDETSTSSQERSYIELSDNQATTGYIRQYWSTTQNQLRIRTLARHGEAAGSWGDIQQIIDKNGNYRVNISCQGTLVNTALTGATNSSTNGEIPTKGWVNNPATSTNVVHRTGDETVGGIKTLTSNPVISKSNPGITYKDSDMTRGSTPVSNLNNTLATWLDTNGNTMGYIQKRYGSDGYWGLGLQVTDGTNYKALGIEIDSSGNVRTIAPTPAAADNSTKIATTAYVKAQGYASDSDVVKTSGNQTVGGIKTFSTNIIRKFNTTVDGTNHYNIALIFKDSNETTTGILRNAYYSDNTIITGVQTQRTINGVTKYASLEVGIKEDGTFYTQAPTPATSDKSTMIATTAFVKSVLSSSGNGLATYSKDRNGYYKFANGLIMQWGYNSSFGTDTVVTYPQAFSSETSYSVMVTPITDNGSGYPTYLKSQTATTFTGKRYDSNKTPIQWLAIGY